MTTSWIFHGGKISALFLVAVGLGGLQVSFAGIGLNLYLPAYGVIALAALVTYSGLRLTSKTDRLCLYSAGLFFGYIALRAFTSPILYWAREDLYCVLTAVVLYALSVTALSRSGYRFALLLALLVLAMAHVVVGFVQTGLGHNFMTVPFLENLVVGERASGFYANPDHLAGLLELLGIFGLGMTCWSRRSKFVKVLLGYLTFVCYLGIGLTGSRGGYLGAATSLIVFGILSFLVLRARGGSFLWKYAMIGFAVISIALFAAGHSAFQSAKLSDRITNILAPDNTRFDLWRASIEQWKLQPLVGTGSGTYRFYGRQFRAERMQNDPVVVHNDYLHLLCEYGLTGAVTFLLFFFAHLRYGWRTFLFFGPRRLAAGTLAGSDRLALNIGALSALSAYVIHSIVDFNLHIPANALLGVFVFSILAAPGTPAVSETLPSLSKGNTAFSAAAALLAALLLFQCIRLFPGEFYTNRASEALADENPSNAVALATTALSYDRRNPNTFFYLGSANLALAHRESVHGKAEAEAARSFYDAAETAFRTARQLVPLEEEYPLDLGSLYDELGRFPEAEWMFSIARKLDPNSLAVAALYRAHLSQWKLSAHGG